MNQNWHYIYPKKLLLRDYSTLKNLLSTIKITYRGEMKKSLCVLMGTLSVRLTHNTYHYHTH